MPWLSTLLVGLVNQMPASARGAAVVVILSLMIVGPGVGLFIFAQVLQMWGMRNIPACTIGLIAGEVLVIALLTVWALLIRRAIRKRAAAKP